MHSIKIYSNKKQLLSINRYDIISFLESNIYEIKHICAIIATSSIMVINVEYVGCTLAQGIAEVCTGLAIVAIKWGGKYRSNSIEMISMKRSGGKRSHYLEFRSIIVIYMFYCLKNALFARIEPLRSRSTTWSGENIDNNSTIKTNGLLSTSIVQRR